MTSTVSWRGLEVLVVSPTPTHPQDHGNRKRIFEICRALRQKDAKVHFVYYPAEHDWRYDRPTRHENAMMAEWDSYQLVAPTRPLHSPPRESMHEIDEWADPSVSGYLAWACLRRRYDVAIVNYTWMSFAFEAIPSETYKVLDTHDVFGNRRQLLKSIGVEPEFFYTTPSEEARGVKRADLVWAIKDAEHEYFERELGVTDCLTVLHAEPQRLWWKAAPSRDGWLRAGVMGARNNLNRRNLERFLDAALPIFVKHMAPVKIIIAGGCSDDFEGWGHPNVEVIGRVAKVEDFYRSVDVVIAPMAVSTGLKIKVSEALASGAPVVAHAHAMEGYPTFEPLHQLPNFEAMARELAKLAFDAAVLAPLAARSHAICAKIQTSVDASLEATRARVVSRLGKKICVIAPMQALDPKSLLCDHFQAALDYIHRTADIEVFFTGAAAESNEELLRNHNLQRHIFVNPGLWASLAKRAPDAWTAMPLSELLKNRAYERAYVMADCREEILFGTGALRQAFVRHDLIEIGGGAPDALIERLRKSLTVVVIGAIPGRIRPWYEKAGISDVICAPVRRAGPFGRLVAARGEAVDVLILAGVGSALGSALAKLCERLGARVRAVDPCEPSVARSLTGGLHSLDPLAGLRQAKLLVDLSPQTSLSVALVEAVMHEGVPCIALARGPEAAAFWKFPNGLLPASAGELLRAVAEALADDAKLMALRECASRENHARTANDAGWTALWSLLTAPNAKAAAQETVSDSVASLFG